MKREERDRLKSQKLKILQRLRRGPATNFELNDLAFRYSARIYELRKDGHKIVITNVDAKSGRRVYKLVE